MHQQRRVITGLKRAGGARRDNGQVRAEGAIELGGQLRRGGELGVGHGLGLVAYRQNIVKPSGADRLLPGIVQLTFSCNLMSYWRDNLSPSCFKTRGDSIEFAAATREGLAERKKLVRLVFLPLLLLFGVPIDEH